MERETGSCDDANVVVVKAAASENAVLPLLNNTMPVLLKRAPPIKDYDLPSTIVIYVLVCLLGVGMCFCLRRANRLLPNQLSFQLQPRSQTRGYDRTDEEQGDPESRRGLLSEQDDEDDYDEEEAGWASRRQQHHASQQYQDDDDNESFGDMQDATTDTTSPNHNSNAPRTPLFNIADDDDDDDDDNDNSNKQQHP